MSKIYLPHLSIGLAAAAALLARGHVFALSKDELPPLGLTAPRGLSSDIPQSALNRWNGAVAAASDGNAIDIYDPIGAYFYEGVTVKRIAAQLRDIGAGNDVTVNINSPGGDVFEGIAIYNTIRAHKGKVTVRVVGLAASAASLIAMAGDEIQIGRAAFMMVHNVWVLAIGNRHDLRDAADVLEPFDDALAGVYAARSGKDKKWAGKVMDRETWFSGEQTVEEGLADALLPADQIKEDPEGQAIARADLRSVEIALARHGMPRSERRALLNRLTTGGTPSAAAPQDRITPSADPQADPPAPEPSTPSAAATGEPGDGAAAKDAQAVLERMTGFLKTV